MNLQLADLDHVVAMGYKGPFYLLEWDGTFCFWKCPDPDLNLWPVLAYAEVVS